MRSKTLPFHIQQNTTPEVMKVLLYQCKTGNADIDQLAQELGMGIGTVQHIMPFVRQSGLLNATSFLLTELGTQFHKLAQQSPALLPEAMHHLLYTAHHFEKNKRFSWAYAQVVDALWTNGERTLNGKAMAQLVGMVVDEATRKFDILIEQIAFSQDSVRGILNWLRALEPPTVTNEGKNETFRHRYFCHAPTFLWAVDFLYRAANIAYGVRMFLTPERIEQFCKLCVLDRSGLDNVLMMTKRMSDYDRGGIFDYGTEGGFGRWLLLVRSCPVPTLPEGGR